MTTFVLTYRMPTDYVPAGDDTMAVWAAWFDGLGDRLAERGNPVFESATVGNCAEDTRLGGYSFITADDLESAMALAKGSPTIEAGGGVEVGTVTILDPDRSAGRNS